jgi:hypothetical protein
VAGGYVLAFAAAIAAVHFAGAPQDASEGMGAFGDAILFLGVFCVLSVAPTAYAVYLLVKRLRRR